MDLQKQKVVVCAGMRFTRLVVIEKAERSPLERQKWRCMCDCGKEVLVEGKEMTRAGARARRSCGCLRAEASMARIKAINDLMVVAPSFQDLVGSRFGTLTVVSRCENKITSGGGIKTNWVCLCDCGNEVEKTGQTLKKSKTCGRSCKFYSQLMTKINKERTPWKKEDAYTNTPTHQSWRGMLERCNNPSHIGYERYGGRGIQVCDRWVKSFESFLADMGERPDGFYSIDRIDNDKGYSPENCRWASRKEQSRNTSRNVNISFMGQTKCLTDWAIDFGISRYVLDQRIRSGWDIEQAFTTPARQ